MASPQKDLASLLTPTLFHQIIKNLAPWPAQERLDFKEVTRFVIYGENKAGEEVLRQICWPVLKALSMFGLDHVPNLLQFLPPPESKVFPEQAMGLQLLLDQATRALLRGTDARWRGAYFDVLSRKFAKQLLDIPSTLRADAQSRWVDERGVSFDYWLIMKHWFIAPFTHSEDLADHEIARELIEGGRVEVEKFLGKTDPYRSKRHELKDDTLAFGRMLREGHKSVGNSLSMEDFAFWLWTVMDVHKPVIESFGRYPYKNSAMGREETDREREWIVAWGMGREVDDHTARRIREDVLRGRWTPLGEVQVEK
jgi:uncharacterized protein (DUF924 family)